MQEEGLFFALIKDAFGKRRKTILNALNTGDLKLDKNLLKEILYESNIDENRRGETLTIEEYALLSNNLAKSMIICKLFSIPYIYLIYICIKGRKIM